MVNGFNVNGTPVLYNYDSLGNKLEKTSIAREYSNTDTYNVDDYVIYNGYMYRCKQEISVGESFDSTKWTECSIGPELNYIKKFVGFSEDAKYALLNLLAHVAYTDEHGQDYYDELEATLFQTADVVSISAVFDQGSAVIYDTDELDTLRQYLTVTATYEDLSTREITAYTLSGTLAVGTSTVTVTYGGKTTTFDVVVTESPLLPREYQQVEWIQSDGNQIIDTGIRITNNSQFVQYEIEVDAAIPEVNTNANVFMGLSNNPGYYLGNPPGTSYVGFNSSIHFENIDIGERNTFLLSWTSNGATAICGEETITRTRTAQNEGGLGFFMDTQRLYGSKCRIYQAKVRLSGLEILYLIPCYRKADDAIGMYDLVNNVFYENAGSGSFTKGADI